MMKVLDEVVCACNSAGTRGEIASSSQVKLLSQMKLCLMLLLAETRFWESEEGDRNKRLKTNNGFTEYKKQVWDNRECTRA